MNRGFTLIELIVAVTIFIVVVAITSSIFVNSLKTQRQVVALMAANDNASMTLEQMAREIRTGQAFRTNSQHDRLDFINAAGQTAAYALVDHAITKNNQPITASNVRVEYLLFNLMGEVPDDGVSTRVTINLGVAAVGKGLEGFVTNVQTTVAARLLDA